MIFCYKIKFNTISKAFSHVASQVKKGGMLHVMIYDKAMDGYYDGFGGETCVEKHKIWEKLTWEGKMEMLKEMVRKLGEDSWLV